MSALRAAGARLVAASDAMEQAVELADARLDLSESLLLMIEALSSRLDPQRQDDEREFLLGDGRVSVGEQELQEVVERLSRVVDLLAAVHVRLLASCRSGIVDAAEQLAGGRAAPRNGRTEGASDG